jgi:hypothetical protein
MKVWVVMGLDEDMVENGVVYASEALAEEHTRLVGGFVNEKEALEALHPEAEGRKPHA